MVPGLWTTGYFVTCPLGNSTFHGQSASVFPVYRARRLKWMTSKKSIYIYILYAAPRAPTSTLKHHQLHYHHNHNNNSCIHNQKEHQNPISPPRRAVQSDSPLCLPRRAPRSSLHCRRLRASASVNSFEFQRKHEPVSHRLVCDREAHGHRQGFNNLLIVMTQFTFDIFVGRPGKRYIYI
jgi:hypothetical protein